MESNTKKYWSNVARNIHKNDDKTPPTMWNQASESVADPWDQERDHSQCEKWVKFWWENRGIKFLVDEIKMLGREMTVDRVRCVGGTKAMTLSGQGGYLWRDVPEAGLSHGDIAVSEKDCHTSNTVKIALRHELLHAFDDARALVDPSDCLHHACSEIRAARLSGECAIGEELLRGKSIAGDGGKLPLGQQCVQRRAVLSVSHNPTCSRIASTAVDTAWEACIADTAPYHRFPLDILFN
eukprot:TRINITY_DN30942_c0_g1_i1.p1 TRINITY_DN30942_c0_g1~~TRINITY_DN30942_c0_g1_i1.p1  ORF type:complete len:257 (+),score=44.94 TRINITY_DN30942_c0_g1_i1:57-773(+)